MTAIDTYPQIFFCHVGYEFVLQSANFHNYCVAKLSHSFTCSVLTDLCDACDDLQHFKCAVSHIPIDIMQAFLQDGTHLINGGALQCVHKQCQVGRHEVLDGYLHQLKCLHRQPEHSAQQVNCYQNKAKLFMISMLLHILLNNCPNKIYTLFDNVMTQNI